MNFKLMNQAQGVGQSYVIPSVTPGKMARGRAGASGAPGEEGRDYFREPPKTNGKLRDEPMDTITPDRVWQSVRMRWEPIKGLTFERLVSYLSQFWYGYFRMAAMTWQQMMRRDYQLRIVAPKRFKSVARHGYEICTVADLDEADKAIADEQKEFLQEFWDNISVTTALNPDETGGAGLLLRQMMEAHFYYYAVHEIIWQPQDDGTLTAKFIYCPLWWFEGVRGKLRYLDSEFQVWGREMEDGEWLVTTGDGLAETCSIIYMLKHGAIRSWVNYLDKFGMPGLIGKTHAKKGQPEWNAMSEAVRNFSQEWATVIGGCSGDLKENDVSLLQAANAANGQAFHDLIEKLDRAQTQLFRGGDLGTSSGNDRQGASLQGDESEILETDDAKQLEETLTSQVSRYALAWKYGDDVKALVYLKLRTTPESDYQGDIAVDTFLLSNGAELPMQATFERYNRSLPKEGEDVLRSPMAMTQQAQLSTMMSQPQGGAPGEEGPPDDGSGEEEDQSGEGDNTEGQFGNEFMRKAWLLRYKKTPKRANAQFTNKATLDQQAKQQFLRAYVSDTAPIVERLKAIYRIQDPEIFKTRLVVFMNDLDRMKKDLGQDSDVAQVLQKLIASNMANGMALVKT